MKTTTRIASSLALLTFMTAGLVQAATFSPGTSYTTPGSIESLATGSTMTGMLVRACFFSGDCEDAHWAPDTSDSDRPNAGGVSGTGWSMSLAGDTFGPSDRGPGLFSLDVTRQDDTLTSLLMDGRPGKTVFDLGNGIGTPGSAEGKSFLLISAPAEFGNIDVLYTDRLLLGDVFYGDLYLVMRVSFTTSLTGLLEFIADTDNVDGNIIEWGPPTPVPTPGTTALVGAALLALGAARRRPARRT